MFACRGHRLCIQGGVQDPSTQALLSEHVRQVCGRSRWQQSPKHPPIQSFDLDWPTRLRKPAPCGDLGVVAEEVRSSHASSPDHHSQHSNKPKSNPSSASSVRGAGIGNRLCFRRRDTPVPVAMQTSRVCVHLRGKGDTNRIQFGGVGLRREDVQGDRDRSNSGRRAGSVRHKRVRVGVSAIGAYSRRGWCAH